MITCRYREAIEMVLKREADLAYAEISDVDQGQLETETIGHLPFIFFARTGHPLTQQQTLTKGDFDSYPLVLSRLPKRVVDLFPHRMRVETHGSTEFLVPPVDCLDTNMSRHFVRESDAVSIAVLAQIREELKAGIFQVVPFWQDWMHMQYGFIFLQGRSLVPAAKVFMEEARKLEQALAEEGVKLWKQYLPKNTSSDSSPYV